MSLGSGMGKVVSMDREKEVTNTDPKERLAHVSEDGVEFLIPSPIKKISLVQKNPCRSNVVLELISIWPMMN